MLLAEARCVFLLFNAYISGMNELIIEIGDINEGTLSLFSHNYRKVNQYIVYLKMFFC